MKRSSTYAAVAALLTAGTAYAQPETPPRVIENMGRPVYVAPMISFTIDDSARRTKVGYGGTLALGTRLFSFAAVEAQAYYTKFNDDGEVFEGARTEATGYGGNLLLFPLPGTLRNLFVLAAASYNDVRKHPFTSGDGVVLADYDSTVYDAGLGYLANFALFGNPAALRIEARYRLDEHDEPGLGNGSEDQRFADGVISAGVMFPLFYSPPPPPPAPEPEPVQIVQVADSDGDGVPDDIDQCPDTSAGTEADATGCPVPAPACIPSGQGGEPDLRGCSSDDVVVLRGVTFEFDSARLTPAATVVLDQVARALKAAPDIAVEVGGHTDSRGAESYNQRLSERRAASVRDYLVGRGIDSDRLSVRGYGEARPVADNTSEEGREQNRRVELAVQ